MYINQEQFLIFSPKLPGSNLRNSSCDKEPSDLYIPSTDKRYYSEGPVYPMLAKKLFTCLDNLENTVNQLGNNPVPEKVKDSEIRNIVRWVQSLTMAYKDSYDEEDLKKALKPLKNLAFTAGSYKDLTVLDEQIKSIYPKGIPINITKKLKEYKEEKNKEFRELFAQFKSGDMEKSFKILRKPFPLEETNPGEIQKKDGRKLSNAVEKLIKKIDKVGLYHDDPEEFHDGRKTLRNLIAMIVQTDDIFSYKKEDVEALNHLFKKYGKSQDMNIAHSWLRENGFKKEADIMMSYQKEAQKNAMKEAKEFLKSGALDSIKHSALHG
jgi:IS1 family transposase